MAAHQMLVSMKTYVAPTSVDNPISIVSFPWSDYNAAADSRVRFIMKRDGTWEGIQGNAFPFQIDFGDWAVTPTATSGDTIWVRFTRTYVNIALGGTASDSTGWLSLSSDRTIQVDAYNGGTGENHAWAVYTVELSTSPSGTPIVSTTTGIDINATSDY